MADAGIGEGSGSKGFDLFGLDALATALPDLVAQMLRLPVQLSEQLAGQAVGDPAQWSEVGTKLQTMWQGAAWQGTAGAGDAASWPEQWLALCESWMRQMPAAEKDTQQRLWDDGMALWQNVLGHFGMGPGAEGAAVPDSLLPKSDRRFADPKWREQPYFALVHQSYLVLAEEIMSLTDRIGGVEPAVREQLRFATRTLVDAMSPDHFPLTNPLVIERAIETRGESLIKGLEHMLADLRRGQLTHTDPGHFRIGENIATTPGKVVLETELFQLIQYTPTTEKVLAVPLVIFPPWINRFYILDLNPAKSFVRWAVAQGITTFMVSWKSADASLAEVIWDDYVKAQITAVDAVRARLGVPSVHAIGYCVAGTTLAATLALLARRGEAEKIASATFFTAQVDFEAAGDLKHFVDDTQIATIEGLAPEGYLDGRYMAATFNLLRGNDLIWSYVIRNYLLGQDYVPFDLLHWNGDTTNLPVRWHAAYLRDLYRDNRLAKPDSLSIDGTPIDLSTIHTPAFIQAGREDHIAPPESVWKMIGHLSGPKQFVLAGSGHIAGVVNPPAAGKYQYWVNETPGETLESFVTGAEEHKGSWWPYWAQWLRRIDGAEVVAKGKRKPGGRGDRVIEDAPGRYVRMR